LYSLHAALMQTWCFCLSMLPTNLDWSWLFFLSFYFADTSPSNVWRRARFYGERLFCSVVVHLGMNLYYMCVGLL
jgi:hypothetical protein